MTPIVDKAFMKTAKFVARPGIEALFQYKVYAYLALVVPVLKTKGNTSVILFVRKP